MGVAQPVAEHAGITMFSEGSGMALSHTGAAAIGSRTCKMVKTPFENEVEREPQK